MNHIKFDKMGQKKIAHSFFFGQQKTYIKIKTLKG